MIKLKIAVEKAKLANHEELWKIETECFTIEAFTKEHIEFLLRNPNAIGLIARVNGEVAGFIIGIIENYGRAKIGHVYTIDVAVKHRRRGVGLRLLNEMENTFLKKGVKTSYLEVRVDNQAARTLYKKQGYAEIQSLDDYYSGGIHGLRMVKQLDSRQNVSFRS